MLFVVTSTPIHAFCVTSKGTIDAKFYIVTLLLIRHCNHAKASHEVKQFTSDFSCLCKNFKYTNVPKMKRYLSLHVKKMATVLIKKNFAKTHQTEIVHDINS
eukprot:UN23407